MKVRCNGIMMEDTCDTELPSWEWDHFKCTRCGATSPAPPHHINCRCGVSYDFDEYCVPEKPVANADVLYMDAPLADVGDAPLSPLEQVVIASVLISFVGFLIYAAYRLFYAAN